MDKHEPNEEPDVIPEEELQPDMEAVQSMVTVQIAHNMIVGIILDALPNPYPPEEKQRLEHYAEVLCWVLGHTKNGSAGRDFSDALLLMTDHILAATGRKLLARVERHKAN